MALRRKNYPSFWNILCNHMRQFPACHTIWKKLFDENDIEAVISSDPCLRAQAVLGKYGIYWMLGAARLQQLSQCGVFVYYQHPCVPFHSAP